MDDIVKAAMLKWPNVPNCYGWLALDARGDWYLRDAPTQAAGPFPQIKGSLIEHEKFKGFIQRNYAPDERGAWFFQNGPQRVYVELERTPWVWRVHADGQVLAHTGLPATVQGLWLDEAGRVYLQADRGIGLVHSQDVVLVAAAIEQGRWSPQSIMAAEVPARFGFVQSPERRSGAA